MLVKFEDLTGRRVVIWGTGREGRAAHAELTKRGIEAIFAVTTADAEPLDLAAEVRSGPAALAALSRADVVIKSPGVPHTSSEFVRLRELGVAITSLTDLWLSENAARVLAVTGTKGKSTTSAMAHHLLQSLGVSAVLVGNGGTPVTDGDSAESEVAVTEVSSYQGADLSVSPRIAVVTSLYPEHLPWHGGYDQYVADKLNLLAHGCELVVVPDGAGDLATVVRGHANGAKLIAPESLGITWSVAGIEWAGVGQLQAADIPLPGLHNFANIALAVTAVLRGFEIAAPLWPRLLDAVADFVPLEHRLQSVPCDDGRRWIDDSLATAPEAVVAALSTFADTPVALLLGGADRGLSFEPLRDYLRSRGDVVVVAVGPAGERWMQEGGGSCSPSRLAESFSEAMRQLRANAAAEVILLSPGAPSFDEFVDYEARSAAFRAAALGSIAN